MVAGDEGGEAGGDGVAAAEGRRRAEEGRRLVVGAPVRRAGWWIDPINKERMRRLALARVHLEKSSTHVAFFIR